jgi:hypothetical protein
MGAITQHYGYESAHHALLMMCERDSALRAADGCARERERERESTHHPSLMDVTATVNSALNSRRKRERPQRERERERQREREREGERERARSTIEVPHLRSSKTKKPQAHSYRAHQSFS